MKLILWFSVFCSMSVVGAPVSFKFWAPKPKTLMEDKSLFKESLYDLKPYAKGNVEHRLWSTSFFPFFDGGVLQRDRDPNLQNWLRDQKGGRTWKNFRSYFVNQENSAAVKIKQNKIWQLSPIEKYDLLVGDNKWSLTHSVLKLMDYRYKKNNNYMPGWEGICHGFAASSSQEDAVYEGIKVKDVTGNYLIDFRASDIRALFAQAYSVENKAKAYYLGKNCDSYYGDKEKDLKKRRLNKACFEINPADFHLAVLNKVGVEKKPLILEKDSTPAMFNHPIRSYQILYRNPQTNVGSHDFSQVAIARSQYQNDSYAAYRGSQTSSIVNVVMSLTYIDFSLPEPSLNLPYREATKTVTYRYDLEIDKNGIPRGGEWHSKVRPDYLWKFASRGLQYEDAESKFINSLTDKDKNVTSRQDFQILLQKAKKYAPSSSKQRLPLLDVIRALAQLSRSVR